jgi:N-acetylglucosamine-6-phosphate deacetylase
MGNSEFLVGPNAPHLIHNVTIIDTEYNWVYFNQEKIIAIGSAEKWCDYTDNAIIIDGNDGFISRPFVDTHTHGLAGFAVENGLKSMREIREHQKTFGIGYSILSLVSSTKEELLKNIRDAAILASEDPGFIGLHLEGPYISVERCGAHNIEAIRKPNMNELREILEAGNRPLRNVIVSMTVAPEEFSEEELTFLKAQGIKLCLGHSKADYVRASNFFTKYGNILTHTFNAMNPILHREPGPVPAALDNSAYTELIADGLHVVPAAARLLDSSKVILVSDSMSAAAMPDGEYRLGDLTVKVLDSAARTKTGTLAGSTLTMDKAVKNYAIWISNPAAAIAAATLNPAEAYGITVPKIEAGENSELLLLNSEGNLIRVFR